MSEQAHSGPARRRRRTALVTSRWAASAAVVAAMTVAGGQVDLDRDGDPSAATAFADPPDDIEV